MEAVGQTWEGAEAASAENPALLADTTSQRAMVVLPLPTRFLQQTKAISKSNTLTAGG